MDELNIKVTFDRKIIAAFVNLQDAEYFLDACKEHHPDCNFEIEE